MVVALFIYFFLLFNSQIFCQTYNELEPVIFPDYQFFQPNPEVDSYPGILPNYYYNKYFEIPKSTLYLPSLKIDQLAVKSQFLIDTIYFHNNFQRNEKFKDYKRIFNYDQKLRIISIIAEELLNSKWQKHQETEIIYNDKNKISEIHYLRTNNPFEEFKIVYLFDSFGHLQEEICESKNNEKWSLNWKEKFSMKAGKLSYSDLYYYEDFDRLTFKYVGTDNQLIIESGYFSKDTSHIKYVYELDDRNKLLKFTSLELKDSTWQVYESEDYIFDERDKIIRTEKINNYIKPSYFQSEYLYGKNENLAATLFYRKTFENGIENLTIVSKHEYEYNADNYLLKYTFQFRQDDKLKNKERTNFERDEFNNIVSIKSDIWYNNNWETGSETRIVYKEK